jgi:hypothetical protein
MCDCIHESPKFNFSYLQAATADELPEACSWADPARHGQAIRTFRHPFSGHSAPFKLGKKPRQTSSLRLSASVVHPLGMFGRAAFERGHKKGEGLFCEEVNIEYTCWPGVHKSTGFPSEDIIFYPEAVDMNGRFQMQGGKNWFLPKEMNANRFFWDSHWLEIWSNHFYPSMGPNGGSVAMDSDQYTKK